MSRRKDIQWIHERTGRSYKECRQMMRDCHYDIEEVIDRYMSINQKVPKVSASFRALEAALTELRQEIDKAVKNAAEMVHLSNNLAHCQPTESEGVNWEECQ